MSKAKRQEMVDTLATAIKGSASNIYLTDFAGLNVAKMTDLRRRLRAAGAQYLVVKNTLASRALAAGAVEGLSEHLTGPTGMVLAGEDPLAAAKVLGEFAKQHQKPSVKIGLVDGNPVDAAFIKRLGDLPSRDELLGQFAGYLNGVLYQMVGVLEALKDKREAEEAS